MKFLFAFVCIIATASALDKQFVDQFMQTIREAGSKCKNEVGATASDVTTLMAHEVPETETGKCLIFCMHKRFEIQNEDGGLNKEGANKFLEPVKAADADIHGKLVEVFDVCIASATVDSNPCLTAAGFLECAFKEGKARGIDKSLLE